MINEAFLNARTILNRLVDVFGELIEPALGRFARAHGGSLSRTGTILHSMRFRAAGPSCARERAASISGTRACCAASAGGPSNCALTPSG
jgi:hypothetical protein